MDLEKQVAQLEAALKAEEGKARAAESKLDTVQSTFNVAKQELNEIRANVESLIERDPCIRKALLNPGLPVFTMLGTDKAAPQAIETWAWMADILGAPAPKCTHARQRANEFRNWQADNPDDVKIPD